MSQQFELLKKSAVDQIASDLDQQTANRLQSWENTRNYDTAYSFADGFTIAEDERQKVALFGGEWYRWDGALPKTVPAGSTPQVEGGIGSGAWLSVGDAALRSELADSDKGAAMVARGVVAVDSIADLLALPEGQRREGLRYLVSSYHGGLAGEGPFVGQSGGGRFRWDPSRVGENDGGVVLDGWVREIEGAVTPQMFGAKGDGVNDDRAAIQAAFDFIRTHRGGSVVFPAVKDHYSIKSTHPGYPGHGLVMLPVRVGNGSGYKLVGNSNASRIQLDVPLPITSLLFWPEDTGHTSLSDMWFSADSKADYVLKADTAIHPFLTMEQCDFRYGLEDCVLLSTFLATLTRVTTQRGKRGFRIVGQGSGPVTSIVMDGCYALMARDVGFSFGYATYCTLNSCAVDGKMSDASIHTKIAYEFAAAYGVSMNACGCEQTQRFLKAQSYRGFSINTGFMLSAGGVVDPVDYLIEFVAGTDATISGFLVESTAAGGYNYKLASTQSAYGFENITVLDGCVRRNQIFFTPTYLYSRPIKLLRGDSTQKPQTFAVANADELKAFMLNTLQDFQIDHDFIIQLADGVYDLAGFYGPPKNLGGSGRLVLQGNGGNRGAVTILTSAGNFIFESVTCDLVLKDITISSSVGSGAARRVSFIRCPRVLLSNVAIERNGVNVGRAINAVGSNITLADGTVSNGPFIETAYSKDAESAYYMEATTPPSTGYWSSGFRITNPLPVAGGYAGFVCTASGTPGTWKGYGAVEA